MHPPRDESELAHEAGPGDAGRRADAVLARAFPDHSRSAIQRAFAAGLVRRDGKPMAKSDGVRAGDRIVLAFPSVRPAGLAPREIPLEVLFEDRQLLAVNKAAGMVVHPGAGTGGDTLVHALLAHCAGRLSGIGGVERPGIVHRLDRETSGVILVAKTDAAHRNLSEQFAERTVRKEYLALAAGVPPLLSGSIRGAIGRNPRHRHKMAVFEAESGQGREARTDWTRVERFGRSASLLRCTLHSGRTHQIRVHLKSIGHVLLGDVVYGYRPIPGVPQVCRTMLHAELIGFRHPRTGKEMVLRAALPADFSKLVAALRSISP
ncbi:MAG: RluA family pseudouridine synthase [Opitutaceae bacterium]